MELGREGARSRRSQQCLLLLLLLVLVLFLLLLVLLLLVLVLLVLLLLVLFVLGPSLARSPSPPPIILTAAWEVADEHLRLLSCHAMLRAGGWINLEWWMRSFFPVYALLLLLLLLLLQVVCITALDAPGWLERCYM